MRPGNQPSRAYADESFIEKPDGGCYVLAAAVFDIACHDDARRAMCALRKEQRARHITKLHWNKMNQAQQQDAAKTVAALEGFHVVAVGSPLPLKRQERTRATCLKTLVLELSSLGVAGLLMEARTPDLNQRDVQTVRGARFGLPRGTPFHVEHAAGADEPLLWAADIVAGAVRTYREGDRACRDALEACVYEVEVPTSC